MFRFGPYLVKRAETPADLEQVHALNCATFAREIPQHHVPPDGRLVDKFHDKNTYFLALRDAQVVGMVSVHDRPPFSVADRMVDRSLLEQPGVRPLEVRLLAVVPRVRTSPVFACLAWAVWRHARDSNYTHLFISGFVDRLELYERIGFERLGPPVGPAGAQFVPMCLEPAAGDSRAMRRLTWWERRLNR